MHRILSIRQLAVAAVLTTAAMLAASSASACDGAPAIPSYHARTYHAVSYRAAPSVRYTTVTVGYEYEKVPFKKQVVAYDEYGDLVIGYKTAYRVVKVPVTRSVKVWH